MQLRCVSPPAASSTCSDHRAHAVRVFHQALVHVVQFLALYSGRNAVRLAFVWVWRQDEAAAWPDGCIARPTVPRRSVRLRCERDASLITDSTWQTASGRQPGHRCPVQYSCGQHSATGTVRAAWRLPTAQRWASPTRVVSQLQQGRWPRDGSSIALRAPRSRALRSRALRSRALLSRASCSLNSVMKMSSMQGWYKSQLHAPPCRHSACGTI